MNLKTILKRIPFYLIGIVIISFGVILVKKSAFGSGAWDAVSFNLIILVKEKIGITVASLIVNLTLLVTLIVSRKNLKFIVSAVAIILTSIFLGIWEDHILVNMNVTNLYLRMLIFSGGLIGITFGSALVVKSALPATVFDELTFLIMDTFKLKTFFTARIIFEGIAVVIASIFGLIGGGGFFEVSVGTLIIAVAVGPLIDLFLKVLRYEKAPIEETL